MTYKTENGVRWDEPKRVIPHGHLEAHKPTELNDARIYIPEAEPEIVPLAIRMHNAFPYILAGAILLSLATAYFVS